MVAGGDSCGSHIHVNLLHDTPRHRLNRAARGHAHASWFVHTLQTPSQEAVQPVHEVVCGPRHAAWTRTASRGQRGGRRQQVPLHDVPSRSYRLPLVWTRSQCICQQLGPQRLQSCWQEEACVCAYQKGTWEGACKHIRYVRWDVAVAGNQCELEA